MNKYFLATVLLGLVIGLVFSGNNFEMSSVIKGISNIANTIFIKPNGTDAMITASTTLVTVGGDMAVLGGIDCASYNEAQLKALAPGSAGRVYYDTTNKALVLSTGAASGEFAMIYDGTQIPTGW